MNETWTAGTLNHNADMRGARSNRRIEHQVSRHEMRAIDRTACGELIDDRAGQRNAMELRDIADEATAVETLGRRGTAEPVRCADKRARRIQNQPNGCRIDRGSIGRPNRYRGGTS